jgi:hypothetical protein
MAEASPRISSTLLSAQSPVKCTIVGLRQASCVAGLGVRDTQGHLASVRASEKASD